jgi:transcriptional regulator with XRE-family HTH domain
MGFKSRIVGVMPTTFGHRLRDVREARGVSQVELGRRVGMKQTIISRYETQDVVPSLDKVLQFAAALEVPCDELFAGISAEYDAFVQKSRLTLTADVTHSVSSPAFPDVYADYSRSAPHAELVPEPEGLALAPSSRLNVDAVLADRPQLRDAVHFLADIARRALELSHDIVREQAAKTGVSQPPPRGQHRNPC